MHDPKNVMEGWTRNRDLRLTFLSEDSRYTVSVSCRSMEQMLDWILLLEEEFPNWTCSTGVEIPESCPKAAAASKERQDDFLEFTWSVRNLALQTNHPELWDRFLERFRMRFEKNDEKEIPR